MVISVVVSLGPLLTTVIVYVTTSSDPANVVVGLFENTVISKSHENVTKVSTVRVLTEEPVVSSSSVMVTVAILVIV